jgi:RNA polymerase II subunit A small phosphatase-like protein
VLVDDTPLAFLHQPECGVPVLQFRGDPDDRLLMEAVLPLVQVRGAKCDAPHESVRLCWCVKPLCCGVCV